MKNSASRLLSEEIALAANGCIAVVACMLDYAANFALAAIPAAHGILALPKCCGCVS